MGKLKNMLIEMEEMNLTGEPLPWEMGAPLCRRCDSSKQNVITKDDKTIIVSCSYCDRAMQVLDK
jgi:hypothetical protein|tara:strand:+ start:329 stop:523 length:195 start_codon:yes stop_codon:yes gene_type:complete